MRKFALPVIAAAAFAASLGAPAAKAADIAIGTYLFEALVIIAFALFAFRVTQVRKLVAQYPWLYERNGPFAWREKMPQVQRGN